MDDLLGTHHCVKERLNEAFALISFFIIFCTTLTLSLVFIPKVIEVIRTPIGTDQQRYRKGMMRSMTSKTSKGSSREEKFSEQMSMYALYPLPTTTTAVLQAHLRGGSGEDLPHRGRESQAAREPNHCRQANSGQSALEVHESINGRVKKSAELWDLLERLRALDEAEGKTNGGRLIYYHITTVKGTHSRVGTSAVGGDGYNK